jgi:hypothetical protein
MGMLAPALIAGGSSILGSVLGGKSQQNAAKSAAQAQQDMETQQLQYLQNAGIQARNAISGMLPDAQGAAQAGSATQQSAPFLPAGQGAVFGGQQVNSTPNSGSPYSSLLSPSAPSQVSPSQGFVGGMRTNMPQQAPRALGTALSTQRGTV